MARYRQVFREVPVFGSDVIVNTSVDGGLLAMSAKLSPGLTLSTRPTVPPEEAMEAARRSVAGEFALDASSLTVTTPELWIYDGSMLGFDRQPAILVWKLEVRGDGPGANLNVLVLADAQHGGISLQFNQIDTSWRTDPGAAQPGPPLPRAAETLDAGFPYFSVYTMRNSSEATALPGAFLCDQNDTSRCDRDRDARRAYRHASDTYGFYYGNHGRDSIDNAGMTIVSSVHFGVGFRNAFWYDVLEQMVYGEGFPVADDVVAHELTHGVTRHESNLYYYGQPGAINESLSDLWGEFVDQTNGSGTDTAAARWLLGEDLPGIGAVRNMKNPPAMSDPDKMTSSHYYLGYEDNAGVHINSGVNNKAAYLMAAGGVFNGKTVTGLGLHKTAMIYYEAQTNLLGSGANYLDLYYALRQACVSLIGSGGISVADCQEVRDATDAVEMNRTKSAAMYPTVDYCPRGQTLVQELLSDDFESGPGKWAFRAISGNQLWRLDTRNFDASSKVGSLRWNPHWGGETGSDSYAALRTSVLIPPGPTTYLRFEHDFNFNYDQAVLFDGGVVEYSTDGGATWKDLAPRFSGGMPYNGTISTALDNPLGGRRAFAKWTVNYTASRYDLGALAGKPFRVRFRAGSDSHHSSWGWVVDDVRLYTCVGVPALPVLQRPGANALVFDYTPRLEWSDAEPDADHYDLQVATDSAFSSFIVDIAGLSNSGYTLPSLDPDTRYYWRVSAHNVIDRTRGWTAARTFRTALPPPTLTAPADGSVEAGRRPLLDWEDVAGAAGYELQISKDGNFSQVVLSAATVASTYTPRASLPASTRSFWRIRSKGVNGPSAWSSVRRFTTAQ